VKTLLLALFVLAVAPRLALAADDPPDRNVTCRFVVMTNSTVCDSPSVWTRSPKTLANSTPLTFDEEVRLRAREMSEAYVKKGQCDKARKRSLAAQDAAFTADIERRCAVEGAAR
jgi:hypothetical protein